VIDADIRRTVIAALSETGDALIKKWGFGYEQHQNHINDLLDRFANEALGDQVARVGRDPIRKLGPNDRLIGGAKFALEHGVHPVNMCKGIAAALLYDNPEDPAAVQIQEKIKTLGIEGTLKEISGLEPDSPITQEVVKQIPMVKKEFLRA
jgi:mannitol-1-phosphate 5-dehydrogenase